MGWSVCPHDDLGHCVLLNAECQPAMRGCVLYRSVSRDELVGRTGPGVEDSAPPAAQRKRPPPGRRSG